ncbi:MAG: hypothetical protein DME26_21205, partial [Verrucomicrobia bacterium]
MLPAHQAVGKWKTPSAPSGLVDVSHVGLSRRRDRANSLDQMNGTDALILVATAGIAGVINAVAGGGTLITFPALLLTGTPAIVANATSTLALVIGTIGSVFGFRQQIATVKPWLHRFTP